MWHIEYDIDELPCETEADSQREKTFVVARWEWGVGGIDRQMVIISLFSVFCQDLFLICI